MNRVCVFCGSNRGVRPEYQEAAESMGRELAGRRSGLVYGGGNIGLMGVLADSALAAGGEVTGVIPEALMARELGHTAVDLRVVGSMHERKALMAELADGFIALPGGFGTFEEFCEVLTWSQLGIHPKPCGLLNVGGYYDPLLALFDRAVEEGFVRREHRALVLEGEEPAELLVRMMAYRPPAVHKWLNRISIEVRANPQVRTAALPALSAELKHILGRWVVRPDSDSAKSGFTVAILELRVSGEQLP